MILPTCCPHSPSNKIVLDAGLPKALLRDLYACASPQ